MPSPRKTLPNRYELILPSPRHLYQMSHHTNITIQLSSVSSTEEKKPFAWRMQNPEARKYQLFPREKQLPSPIIGKQLDPEQAFAMAMGQAEKTSVSNGLRMRIKEHNLTRRRKISVPELGPMTTVQEVSMDSRESKSHVLRLPNKTTNQS